LVIVLLDAQALVAVMLSTIVVEKVVLDIGADSATVGNTANTTLKKYFNYSGIAAWY
jgi:hypothetical protein